MRALIIVVAVGVLIGFAPVVAAAAETRPNVVILMTDDQRWDKVIDRYMPNVTAELMPYALTGFAPNSLCCPSRTSVLSGDYSHSTGVWGNDGTFGGYAAFNDKHTIAVDFQQAGYRTAMLGKYLNGYEPGDTRYVPPGWTRWFALRTGDYYGYQATTRLRPTSRVRTQRYGFQPHDYATNVLRRQALDFVADSGTHPFFLYLAWTAPHGPAIPDDRDIGRFAGDADYTFGRHTSMLDAAYGVDRATGRILAELPADTVVVFMSDNGYLWGEHGLTGKQQPYEEATRVPFAIRGIAPLETALAANVDLRPTLTAAAGVPMLTAADGIDLVTETRDALVLEHGATEAASYCGVRTAGWMYARYADGQELLFDLTADYGEDHSLVNDMPDKVAALNARTQELCSPAPPGYSFDGGTS